MQDKGLFLLVLSLLCFWLVLDEFYGKHYITNFIVALIPNAKERNNMQTLYESMGAIIGFSAVVLVIQNFIGEKAAQYTVLFTLMGMLILNSDKILNFANKVKGDN